MDKLGKTNVALFNGCFCLALSLWPCWKPPPLASGRETLRRPIGEPCGLTDGDPCEAATTKRLIPAPRRPEKAVNAELTEGGIPSLLADVDVDA